MNDDRCTLLGQRRACITLGEWSKLTVSVFGVAADTQTAIWFATEKAKLVIQRLGDVLPKGDR